MMTPEHLPKSISRSLLLCVSLCLVALPHVAIGQQDDKAATKTENSAKPDKSKSVKKKQEEKKKVAPSGGSNLTSWQQLVGTDYLGLPDIDREIYVIGLSDAYNWSYAGGFKKMRWIVDCTEKKYGTELTTMFDEWLASNPDRWEEPAAKLFAFAMFQQCDFAGASK
jgi:hypothetical protein